MKRSFTCLRFFDSKLFNGAQKCILLRTLCSELAGCLNLRLVKQKTNQKLYMKLIHISSPRQISLLLSQLEIYFFHEFPVFNIASLKLWSERNNSAWSLLFQNYSPFHLASRASISATKRYDPKRDPKKGRTVRSTTPEDFLKVCFTSSFWWLAGFSIVKNLFKTTFLHPCRHSFPLEARHHILQHPFVNYTSLLYYYPEGWCSQDCVALEGAKTLPWRIALPHWHQQAVPRSSHWEVRRDSTHCLFCPMI